MKRTSYLILLAVILVAIGVVVALQPEKDSMIVEKQKKTEEAVPEEKENPVEKVDALLADMTLEEKVGQLMMVGFSGLEKSKNADDLIKNKHIGGFIYFDRNLSSPKQAAELSNSLQESAVDSNQLPLMIAVDQEGGTILRMREQVSPIPSQAKLESAQEVFDVAKLNAAELTAMGMNINFAPVLDLSKTDSRSFGNDPKKAAAYGAKVIEGFQTANVTGALKHFPGHGRSSVDPHLDQSSVDANQLDLENSDIYPFREIINSVAHSQFFVMVTHIKYPAYDKEKPASLSKVIIQDLLRKKLGYEGIVVTDDLEMGAVNKYYSYKNLGAAALLAGADLLLVCHEYDHQIEVYNGVMEAVKNGKIPMERIDEAAKRIITYKLETMDHATVDPAMAEKTVRSAESVRYLEGLK